MSTLRKGRAHGLRPPPQTLQKCGDKRVIAESSGVGKASFSCGLWRNIYIYIFVHRSWPNSFSTDLRCGSLSPSRGKLWNTFHSHLACGEGPSSTRGGVWARCFRKFTASSWCAMSALLFALCFCRGLVSFSKIRRTRKLRTKGARRSTKGARRRKFQRRWAQSTSRAPSGALSF